MRKNRRGGAKMRENQKKVNPFRKHKQKGQKKRRERRGKKRRGKKTRREETDEQNVRMR